MGTKLSLLLKHQKFRQILTFIIVALIFGLAYTQDPIYNSVENQNTKFLHGLAQAGYGWLAEDWVANTIDPLPVFSWLVKTTYQYLHPEYCFYVYYFILFGIYVYSIFAIVNYIYDFHKSSLKNIAYFAAFIVLHTVHLHILELDTGIDLHYGVALQYVLGPVFQPSTFGVLIICSICCSLYQRYIVAVILLAIAATIHPTYLVSAGILTFAYQVVILIEEQKIFKAFLIGLLSLALVLPVYSYMTLTFAPTNSELWQQAQEIIVRLRVPHHSLPQVWLKQDGYKSYLQTLIVIVAIWLVRKTRLMWMLLIPLGMAIISTILQLIIDSNTIAFIAPWRISIVLVPISSSIILAAIVFGIFDQNQLLVEKHQYLIRRWSVVIVAVIAITGTVDQALSFGYGETSNQMMAFVKTQGQSGQTYLVPPDLSNMKKFRLATGVPIFINDKTHPYKDVEVLEWASRLKEARSFYEINDHSCNILSNLQQKYNLTHVVLYQEQRQLKCENFDQIYNNKNYQVSLIKLNSSNI